MPHTVPSRYARRCLASSLRLSLYILNGRRFSDEPRHVLPTWVGSQEVALPNQGTRIGTERYILRQPTLERCLIRFLLGNRHATVGVASSTGAQENNRDADTCSESVVSRTGSHQPGSTSPE